jgi:hypothetical protein
VNGIQFAENPINSRLRRFLSLEPLQNGPFVHRPFRKALSYWAFRIGGDMYDQIFVINRKSHFALYR